KGFPVRWPKRRCAWLHTSSRSALSFASARGRYMRAKEIRDLTSEEIRQKERELAEELFRLRLRKSTGQLDNPMRLRNLRRDIARLKTIQHERARLGTGEQ